MTDSNARLRKGLRLQHVPRWTTVPTIRNQNVAEHSHAVAVICVWLMGVGDNPIVKPEDVLRYALSHDELEASTGDIPSTAKSRGLVEVTVSGDPVSKTTKDIVKIADFLEAISFLQTEIALGNMLVDEVLTWVIAAATEYYEEHDWLHKYFGMSGFSALMRAFLIESNPKLHPGMRSE